MGWLPDQIPIEIHDTLAVHKYLGNIYQAAYVKGITQGFLIDTLTMFN